MPGRGYAARALDPGTDPGRGGRLGLRPRPGDHLRLEQRLRHVLSGAGANSSATTGRIDLIRGIPTKADGSPGLSFSRLTRSGTTASTNVATKSVQVVMTLSRTVGRAAKSTSSVTANYLLRNKPAS